MKKYEKRTKKMQDRLDALNVVYVFIVISLILKKLILKKWQSGYWLYTDSKYHICIGNLNE